MRQTARQQLLIVIARYWPAIGGSELHTRELVRRLSKYHDVTLAYVNHHSAHSNEQALTLFQHTEAKQAANVVQLQLPWLLRALMTVLLPLYKHIAPIRGLVNLLLRRVFARQLGQLCKQRHIRMIHAVFNGLPPLIEGTALAAKRQHIPFIFTPLTQTELPYANAWTSAAMQRVYRLSDRLIALTEYEKSWLNQVTEQPTPISVCPMGPLLAAPDSNDFARQVRQRHPKFLLFLGRMDPLKGVDLLIQAMPTIWAQHPDVHLVLAGPDTEQHIAQNACATDSRIHWYPDLSQADKTFALNAAEALVVPSYIESQGVVYMEAWSQRTPVIAGKIATLASFIRHRENGLLTEHTPKAVSDNVCQLLADPPLKQTIANNGFTTYQCYFRWDHTIKSLNQIYQKLRNSRQTGQKSISGLDPADNQYHPQD